MAEFGDLIDWVWDMRKDGSKVEVGWFYPVIFSLLGSREKEEADSLWGTKGAGL